MTTQVSGPRPTDQERRAALHVKVWRTDPPANLTAEDEASLLEFIAKDDEAERRLRYVDAGEHRTRVTVRSGF